MFNVEPAATADDVQAASLQFLRKVSGFREPSSANQAAFDAAVDDIAAAVDRLLHSLVTRQTPRDRDAERAKPRGKAEQRFAP